MRLTNGAFCSAAVLVLAACAGEAQAPRQPAPGDVVATVGGAPITLAEVDEPALKQSAGNFGSLTLSQALYEARRAALEDIVSNRLLEQEAKSRGTDKATLAKTEIADKVVAPTEIDVAAWYKANPARVSGAPLDQVAGPIRSLLTQERTQAAQTRFIDSLKARTAVKIMLDPPRIEVAEAGRPAIGPAGAPIEVIEFSDFQCPFCLRSYPTVKQVMTTYGNKIRFVYRHFPLPNHPNARPAAEAAACAADQGKFWEYHDRLFENQSKLADADLKQHAAALGLDAAKFNACFDQKAFSKDVTDDVQAGQEAGVSGTPAFFINGRPLSGAQPFEAFKRVIDEELARK